MKCKPSTYSFRTKLTLLVTMMTGIALMLAWSVVSIHEYAGIESIATHDATVAADVIGINSTAALSFDDRGAAEETLMALRAEPGVLAAAIHGTDGTIFAEYQAEGMASNADWRSDTDEVWTDDAVLFVRRPISLAGEQLGTISVAYDLMPQYMGMIRQASTMLAITGLLFLVAFLLATRFQRVLTRPVQVLSETAKRVSEERDYSARAAVLSGDELGQLTETFNEMLGEIQNRDVALKDARDQLERRVEERTSDLARANEQLHGEIVERERAEAEKRERLDRVWRQHSAVVSVATDGTLTSGDLPAAMRMVTEVAAGAIKVARASVWLMDEAGEQLRCVDLFEMSSGIHSEGETIRVRDYPRYFEALNLRRAIDAHNAATDARTIEFAEDYLIPVGITSMLDATIRVSGKFAGVVCLEHKGDPRTWTDDMITFAGELADQVAQAVVSRERKNAEEELRESEQWFRTITGAAQDAIIMMDPEGMISYWNEAARSIFGYSEEEAIGQSLHVLLAPKRFHEAQSLAMQEFQETGGGGAVDQVVELEAKRKNGEEFPVELSLSAVEVRGRWHAVGIMRDITERKRADEALRLDEARLEAMVELNQMTKCTVGELTDFALERAVQLTGSEVGYLAFLNEDESVLTMHSWSKTTMKQCRMVEQPITFPVESTGLWGEAVRQRKPVVVNDYDAPNPAKRGIPEGHVKICRHMNIPVFDGERIVAVAGVGNKEREYDATDVRQLTLLMDGMWKMIERRRAEEALRHDALHDSLTGLANRSLLLDRAGACIERRARDPEYRYALLFIDLDRFKVINDSLGHEVGDQLLIGVAERLRTCLRATDSIARVTPQTIARIGGDEFVVLLDDIHAVGDTVRVAQRLLDALAQPFEVHEQDIFMSASIGIASCEANYSSGDEILRDADTAMYRAKDAGKARYAVFDKQMHREAIVRLHLENDLRRAVEQEQLIINYQPIVSMYSDQLAGFEALLRWDHPHEGLISPSTFVPIAEETGLIVPIGRWVLENACRHLREWKNHHPERSGFSVSVNVSKRQIMEPGFISDVDRIMRENHLSGNDLAIEITESVVAETPQAVAPILAELQNMGIPLHMDDFGTGESSLSCLHHFPIRVLKIDRQFISNMQESQDYAAVVNAIIALAHHMGMQVIAEGVESLEQVNQVMQMNCDYCQGYYFSRPLSAEAVEEFIVSYGSRKMSA